VFFFTVAFIFPLCMLRNISKLEYSSFAAVAIIVFFTGVIIVMGCEGLANHTADFHDKNWHPMVFKDFFNALPVLALAFTCQMNVFPIWSELHNPTVERMNKINFASMSLSSALYILTGFFGYIMYPDNKENILIVIPQSTFYVVLRIFFILAISLYYLLL